MLQINTREEGGEREMREGEERGKRREEKKYLLRVYFDGCLFVPIFRNQRIKSSLLGIRLKKMLFSHVFASTLIYTLA